MVASKTFLHHVQQCQPPKPNAGSLVDMATKSPFELLDLPDEILLIVLRCLDFDSQLKVHLVSKHLQALVEPFIYESATVLHGEKALHLSHSLIKDKRRSAWVRSLLISTRFGQEYALEKLQPFICMMNNLQDLKLETPDCNAIKPEDRVSWIRLQNYYERVFQESSVLIPDRRTRLLPNLKSCVLHFVDTHTELYPLSRYSSVFLHPTLESLTISCMSTDYPKSLFKDVENITLFQRSTALRHLHLEECDIHAPSLEILLSFPRALKSLKISEGIRYDGIFRAGSSRMHGNVRPLPLVQALVNTCKDSLESLSLALGYIRSSSHDINHNGQFLKLTDLTNLKHLEVNNRTLNLIRSRTACDHNTWKRLPTSLETFKVFAVPLLPSQNDARKPDIPLEPCIVRNKQLHGVPKLRKITYSYEHYESTDDEEMNFNDLLMNMVYNETNGNPAAAPANAHQNPGHHVNPILNFLQQAVGAANPPHPQPVPAADTNFFTAAMNPNLDMPPQNIQPPRFRWRTGPNSSRRRSHPAFTRSETAKWALLTTIHESVLSHFKETQTRLVIDLVTLPRGFIPPYLFPEDKPKTQKAWFTSTKPTTPERFYDSIKRKRAAARGHVSQRRNVEEEGDHYDSERERSRSRFMRRVRAGEYNENTDSDSDEENLEIQAQMIANEQNQVLQEIIDEHGGDDQMEVEDMVEMLVAEAHAGIEADESDSASASSASTSTTNSEGTLYVDAESDVEMSEADVESESEEDEDAEDVDEEDEVVFFPAIPSRQSAS